MPWRGDESDTTAITADCKPLDSVPAATENAKQPAVGLGSARRAKAITPFPQGRLRGSGDTAGKTRPSLACARPPWDEGLAGRWHSPCLAAPKDVSEGIPGVSPRQTGWTRQEDTASERTLNTMVSFNGLSTYKRPFEHCSGGRSKPQLLTGNQPENRHGPRGGRQVSR